MVSDRVQIKVWSQTKVSDQTFGLRLYSLRPKQSKQSKAKQKLRFGPSLMYFSQFSALWQDALAIFGILAHAGDAGS